MSNSGYQQYGGNPYGGANDGQQGVYPTQSATSAYGQQDAGPGGYGSSDPYGAGPGDGFAQPAAAVTAPLSNQDFLGRVDGTRADIRQLTANVSDIASLHQKQLNSPDSTSSNSQLERIVSQTQILNAKIRDQIKFLETDCARSGKNTTKDAQIRMLKGNFRSQLEDYQKEESTYRQRYKDQIARQYRIVNPDASDAEVQEATNANWGDEGVFQTALKSNRTGAANSVLGAVRARHNDIQKIEQTLIELNQLFQDLAEQVIVQDTAVQNIEQKTDNVVTDTEAGNVQLNKGIVSARRARKLKWWCFFIVVLIIVILALVLGLYFGLNNNNNNKK